MFDGVKTFGFEGIFGVIELKYFFEGAIGTKIDEIKAQFSPHKKTPKI